MEDLDLTFWHGRRVLVTGHTGFKGAWLSLWLAEAGANVTGFALAPETTPSLFDQLGLATSMESYVLDIRDAAGVNRIVADFSPDVVLHLAAQSLVLRSYREPVATWNVNVTGTVHLLDALRQLDKPCAVVVVTTDKVYENHEWEFGYREIDPLGGYDPYSASKAAAEIAVSCWRRSFLADGTGVRVASARAGNVIGGGDWCENRIVPDLVRALTVGKAVEVRNPHATRPWQHVLEPLGGYLHLARRLIESDDSRYQTAFNFGPDIEASRTVGELVAECLKHWSGSAIDLSETGGPHEARRLALVTERARERLGWGPRWGFVRGVQETMAWYKAERQLDATGLRGFSVEQIRRFQCEADGPR